MDVRVDSHFCRREESSGARTDVDQGTSIGSEFGLQRSPGRVVGYQENPMQQMQEGRKQQHQMTPKA